MDLFSMILMESELSASQRKKLHAADFGLPEERKFPLIDADHVRSAIAYFHTCKESSKAELAMRIRAAAKKFGVEISEDSEVNKY